MGIDNVVNTGDFYQDHEIGYEMPGNRQPGRILGRNIYGFVGKPTLPQPPRYSLLWQVIGTDNVPNTDSNSFVIEYYLFKSGGWNNGVLDDNIYSFKTDYQINTPVTETRLLFNTDPLSYQFNSFAKLPLPLSNHLVIPYKNRLYLIGGKDSNGNILASIYTTPIYATRKPVSNDGRNFIYLNYISESINWEQQADFPFPIYDAKYFIINDTIFLVGAKTANGYTYNIYTPIMDSFNIIGWKVVGGIPNNLTNMSIEEYGQALYILGTDTNNNNPTYRLPYHQATNTFKHVYSLGNMPNPVTNYFIRKSYEALYIIGNFTSQQGGVTTSRNQVYFLNNLGNQGVVWFYYKDIPDRYTFTSVNEMINNFYCYVTDRVNKSYILHLRFVIYLSGNKIYYL